jgi:hypothetical protein
LFEEIPFRIVMKKGRGIAVKWFRRNRWRKWELTCRLSKLSKCDI